MSDARRVALARGEGRLAGYSRSAATEQLARRPAALIEWQSMRGLSGIVGCGVGGGSTHYTSVTMAPNDEVFAHGWPSGFSSAYMHGLYAVVRERLAPRRFDGGFARTKLLEQAGAKLGWECRRTEIAIRDGGPRDERRRARVGWRDDLLKWMDGDGGGSKITVWEAYLKEAVALGARIWTRCAATRIVPIRGGYAVAIRHCGGLVGADSQSQSGSAGQVVLRASRVVLAMGAIGTTRFLLEARDKHRTLPLLSPALGGGFSTNGDFGGLLLVRNAGSSPVNGPIATTILDRWRHGRMMLMDLGMAPVLRRWARSACGPFGGAALWMIGVMHAAGVAGRMSLDRRGRVQYTPGRDARLCDSAAIGQLTELARACGARLLHMPAWLSGRHAVTVHPLGGCGMAESPTQGVCDAQGSVFGHGGVSVADGSVIPTALGCPPSMTIAAVAEHVARAIVANS